VNYIIGAKECDRLFETESQAKLTASKLVHIAKAL